MNFITRADLENPRSQFGLCKNSVYFTHYAKCSPRGKVLLVKMHYYKKSNEASAVDFGSCLFSHTDPLSTMAFVDKAY